MLPIRVAAYNGHDGVPYLDRILQPNPATTARILQYKILTANYNHRFAAVIMPISTFYIYLRDRCPKNITG
jgi:hypothetical protein